MGTLKNLLEREGLADPIFRSPRDTYHGGELIEKALTPLQAADFLAYELRKMKKDDPDELWPISNIERAFER
jgi:hypothetical protein